MSEYIQKKSRSELQNLISSVNKTKKRCKVKRNPKFLFRSMVRTVINNLKWLLDEPMTTEKVAPKHLKLTIEEKGLLRTPVGERTAEEQDTIEALLSQLQCLDRYPEKVRESLSGAGTFTYFPPGRVLVAEGHPPAAMYFIISGQVSISRNCYDAGTKEMKSVDEGVLNDGEAFGEVNLLHNEPWPTTMTTLTHVELLTVLKEHFQSILEEFLGEQQREITKYLNRFSYFKDWPQRTIVECCIFAKIVHFENDALIMGDNAGDLLNAYFLIEGKCQVIQHLQIQHIPRGNFNELKIIEQKSKIQDDSFPMSDTLKNVDRPQLRKIMSPFLTGLIVNNTLEQILNNLPIRESRHSLKEIQNHFCQVATLLPGACFGIGESLDNKYILSNSHSLTLLRIPKTFLKFHNKGNIWGRVREFYNQSYPTPQDIFSQFLTNRRWIISRKKYLDSLVKVERPFTGCTSAEAPYHTRLTTDFTNPIFRRIEKVLSKETE